MKTQFKKILWIPALLAGMTILLFSFAPNSASAAIVKPPNNLGLVGYWSLDDATGTKATDFSGNGNTGTLSGFALTGATSTWVTGKNGRALNFDGSNDYLDIGSPADLKLQVFSVAFWYKGSPDANETYIAYLHNTGFSTTGWTIRSGSSNAGAVLVTGDLIASETSFTSMNDGNWHQVVFVNSAVDSRSIYIDGTLSSSSTSALTADYSLAKLFVGAQEGSFGSIVGYISGSVDDIRFYSRALSVTEIQSMYSNGQATVKARNNTGLVGYWSFDDGVGTKATDFSGNGNVGTLAGTSGTNNLPQWIDGKRGKALNFDGTDDQVRIDNLYQSLPNTASSSFSITTWAFEAGFPNIKLLSLTDTPRFCQDSIHCNSTNGRAPFGQWTHLAVVYNGGVNYQIYINGALDVTATAFSDLGQQVSDYYFCLGQNCGGSRFTGLIDDVRIYDRALSATEVANLYSAGATTANPTIKTVSRNGLVGYWSLDDGAGTKATDFSGNGNTGTLTNMEAADWVTGKRGRALSFDGVDDYVNIANTSSSSLDLTNITMSAWVNTTTTYRYIIGKDPPAENTTVPYALSTINGGEFLIRSAGIDYTVSSSVSVVDGVWHNFTATYDGTTMRVYVDGVQTGSGTSYSGSLPVKLGDLRIGADYNQMVGRFFDGSIDDVRIYNRALSPSEIQTIYEIGR